MRINVTSCLTVIDNFYELEIGPRKYYYKEILNDSGKFIEDELSDDEGRIITNPLTLETVRNAIDNQMK